MPLVSSARRIKFADNAKSALRNIYANAKRFCWSQVDTLKAVSDTIYTGDWSRIGNLYQSEMVQA